MIPIWIKEILLVLAKKFLLFLFIIYFLFFVMDFSTNGIVFLKKDPSFRQCLIYIIYQALTYVDYLLPLCFILSALSVLIQKTDSFEFCALQTAGVSRLAIFSSFLLFAVGVILCNLSLSEWAYPWSAHSFIATKKVMGKQPKQPLRIMPMPDQSILLAKNKGENYLEDLFWIKNPKEIWHIKRIEKGDPLLGKFIHKCTQENHRFSLTATKKSATLPFSWEEIEKHHDIESVSLSTLYRLISQNAMPHKKAYLTTIWYQKWIKPLLSLLLLFLFFPICLHFSRRKKSTFIYLSALFFFLLFHMTTESLALLSTNQIISPNFLWSPFFFSIALGSYNYLSPRFFKKNLCNKKEATYIVQ